MININLIPPALRKDGQGRPDALTINIPKEIILGVGGGLVILMIMVHLSLGAIWLMGMGRLAAYNAAWQKVVPYKKQLDALNSETGDLKKKIDLISGMTVKKSLLWAPKFNAISDSVPRGLWITKMTLGQNGLTIDGSVVSKNDDEINNVGIFLSALRQNEYFMQGFSSLEVNSIQREKNDTVEVADFAVMAKLVDTGNGARK